ncbi:MAG: FmdB family zinc ribbon protein [Actinomycetota bacterium]
MPIYSYRCSNCGKVFDKLQKPGMNGKAKCDTCSGEALRLFSPVGIIFKGSGFYKTDYGSKSKSSSGSSTNTKTQDKKKETKAETKDSKKTEAKTSKTS